MYYRKTSYPESGHADVSEDVWEEFQRIRGHLSNVDQNNVAPGAIGRDLVIPPHDPDHNGASDIVGVDERFLYKEKSVSSGSIKTFTHSNHGTWYDLARKGLRLSAVSRGDAPWIVGASVSARVWATGRIKDPERENFLEDDEMSQDEINQAVASVLANPYNPSAEIFGLAEPDIEQRGSLHLRLRSSQGGLSAAEAVAGVNSYANGCSIATVACFFVRGGPVEFSPNLLFRSILNDTNWELSIFQANIFAFGLYR